MPKTENIFTIRDDANWRISLNPPTIWEVYPFKDPRIVTVHIAKEIHWFHRKMMTLFFGFKFKRVRKKTI